MPDNFADPQFAKALVNLVEQSDLIPEVESLLGQRGEHRDEWVRDLARTAVHEAGHAVVAIRLLPELSMPYSTISPSKIKSERGLEPGKISGLTPTAFAGKMPHAKRPAIVQSWATQIYAGGAAQHQFWIKSPAVDLGVDKQLTQVGDADLLAAMATDLAALKKLRQDLCVAPGSAPWEGAAWNAAIVCTLQASETVRAVAKGLASSGTLTRKEIESLMPDLPR